MKLLIKSLFVVALLGLAAPTVHAAGDDAKKDAKSDKKKDKDKSKDKDKDKDDKKAGGGW